MTKEQKAAYWREYRRTHREQYNANQRRRRANETPEHRQERLAMRRANYASMTDDQRAYEFARQKEDRDRRLVSIRKYKREYYRKHRDELLEYARGWKERNYQRHLQYNREWRRRKAIAEGRVYKPRLSRRIPSYATCPAHARWLRRVAETRIANATVSFATAIQSGLTVGRFSA